jgi:uncharacterized protein (TIGR02145 family)
MKKIFGIYLIITIVFFLIFSTDCTKKETITTPILSTSSITNIAATLASGGGNVTSDGGASITARGVCWSTSENPTVSLSTKTNDGTGTGAFTSSITGLTENTLYHVRSYATNSAGTAYGSDITFSTTLTISIPVVTTAAASSITGTTVISGGNVISDEGAAITTRGVCWSTSENPTVGSSKTTDGSGLGPYTSSITGLSPSTIYYVRAYAINNQGIGYGPQVSFTTTSSTDQGIVFNPSLSYESVADVDGNVYKTIKIGAQYWMAENLKTTKYNDNSAIPFVISSNDWAALKTPGYCWYNNDLTNKANYGALYNWYTINTGKLCPSGWNVPSSADWFSLIQYSGDFIAGNNLRETGTAHWISPNSSSTNQYGFTALPGGARRYYGNFYDKGESGYWWTSAVSNVDIYVNSSGASIFVNYEYFGYSVRCMRYTFNTVVKTSEAIDVRCTSATLKGSVNANSLLSEVSFEYGTTTSYGSTIIAIQSPVNNYVSVDVGANLTGLEPGSTYHYRAKIINSEGTTYGDDFILVTPASVTDIDGNLYDTVKIGTQIWMKENLTTTKFNDGSNIPLITDDYTWSQLTTPGYCWYENNEVAYKETYGALYNWYTINTGKLCPIGWHIPSKAEWDNLIAYIGNNNYGGKLKEIGFAHWRSPNTNATNVTRFTALPGGNRNYGGPFYSLYTIGGWWYSTEYSATKGWQLNLFYDQGTISISNFNKQTGNSVRCVQD